MVGNKIRVQYKIFNPDRIAFVETLTSLLTQLAQYIKSYHLVGVTWNPKGGDVSNYTASSAKVAAPAGGGMANVFTSIKSIDQSGGKTAGLNKLVFDNAVSSIEIVNYKGVQVQCKDVVPSVAIDKTDGCLASRGRVVREQAATTTWKSRFRSSSCTKIMDDLAISSNASALYSH
ncbi:hypothetical protein JG687_00001947 [Phytophthora cactorum]|uniref:Adenylate cyclase-associated CAP C-terminal domain-containing protein n=1 Tax=Phytophthora cactorum TaxID=29920 RepID=A0A8T1UYM9_9STRA|nr:hypothetical protein JG687_00001947 [Phytophthora cactorum]